MNQKQKAQVLVFVGFLATLLGFTLGEQQRANCNLGSSFGWGLLGALEDMNNKIRESNCLRDTVTSFPTVIFVVGLVLLSFGVFLWVRNSVSPKGPNGSNAKYSTSSNLVECPFCAELVKSEARVCKHCGKDIEEFTLAKLKAEQEALQAATRAKNLETQALAQKKAERRNLRETRLKEFLKSGKFKLIIGLIVALVLVFAGLLVYRQIVWQSFQSEINRATSIPGSANHIKGTADNLAQKCAIPASSYKPDFSTFDDSAFLWIELNPAGLSYEQIDCMSVGLVGVPYSFWQFWPMSDDSINLPNGYFIGWLDNGNYYFGWATY